MNDRLGRIRDVVSRVTAPMGRWVRLEDVIRSPKYEARGGASRRAHKKRYESGDARSVWVVLHPGIPQVGQKIRVRKAKGGLQERYVQQIVSSALERGDGNSVVAVSRSPVMPPPSTQAHMESVPTPKPPPLLKQRNPRICEECDGPCRPGAGMCDGCRRLSLADPA